MGYRHPRCGRQRPPERCGRVNLNLACMLTFNNRPDEASLIYDSPSTIAVDADRITIIFILVPRRGTPFYEELRRRLALRLCVKLTINSLIALRLTAYDHHVSSCGSKPLPEKHG